VKKTTPKYFLALLLVTVHFWQANLVRPVADDYTLLRIYSQEGFTSSISYIWNNFGGNITPAVIRALFVAPSLDTSNWFGFIAFSITTSLLVIMSYLVLITWLTNRSLGQITINDLLIALLASLAFEGLFTPGLSSAYMFGAAAGVHLWPVCIFILSLKLIDSLSDKQSGFTLLGFLLVSLFLGFIVGNSGFAESSAIFFTLLIIAIWIHTKKLDPLRFNFRIAIKTHLFGVSLGLLTIFIAPGFINRNNRLGKIDEGFSGLLESFRSSLVSFSGELLTHPVWLLGFLIVVSWNSSLKIDSSRTKTLVLYFALIFVMLVLGSTFGYAAWHQSSGLIFLLAPVSFCIPILSVRIQNILKKSGLAYKNIAMIALVFLLLGLMARGVVVQEQRSSAWDTNLTKNFCPVIQSTSSPLLGAEIKYWPIGLGIEDVNRWAWMEEDYRSWLTSINGITSQKCDGSG
jgi:hypothetical protein